MADFILEILSCNTDVRLRGRGRSWQSLYWKMLSCNTDVRLRRRGRSWQSLYWKMLSCNTDVRLKGERAFMAEFILENVIL